MFMKTRNNNTIKEKLHAYIKCNGNKLAESIMKKITPAIMAAIDAEGMEYFDEIEGNPDLMLGHLMKKYGTDDKEYIDDLAERFIGKTLQVEYFDTFTRSKDKMDFVVKSFTRMEYSDDVHFFDEYDDEAIIRCVGTKNANHLQKILNGDTEYGLYDDFACKISLGCVGVNESHNTKGATNWLKSVKRVLNESYGFSIDEEDVIAAIKMNRAVPSSIISKSFIRYVIGQIETDANYAYYEDGDGEEISCESGIEYLQTNFSDEIPWAINTWVQDRCGDWKSLVDAYEND